MDIFLDIALSVAIAIWNTAIQYPLSHIKNRAWASLLSMFVFSTPVVLLLGTPDDSSLHQFVAFFALGNGTIAAWYTGEKWQARHRLDVTIEFRRELLDNPHHEDIP